jgi:hypothetical protein
MTKSQAPPPLYGISPAHRPLLESMADCSLSQRVSVEFHDVAPAQQSMAALQVSMSLAYVASYRGLARS